MVLSSRRWSRGVSAGASCSCGGEPSLLGGAGPIEWVCPKCAASARVCGSAHGTTPCVLVEGHQGDHESVDGFYWGHGSLEVPPPEGFYGVDRGAPPDKADWPKIQADCKDMRAELASASDAALRETVDQVLATVAIKTSAAYQKGVEDGSKDKAKLIEEAYARGVADERERLAGVLQEQMEGAEVERDMHEVAARDMGQRARHLRGLLTLLKGGE